MAVTCTPSGLLAHTPCLQCLSEKELLAGLVAVLADASGMSVETLMTSSACFTCMSKKEMLEALVSIFGDAFGTDVPTLIAQYKCLVCSNEKQLLAAALFLLCHGDITISANR